MPENCKSKLHNLISRLSGHSRRYNPNLIYFTRKEIINYPTLYADIFAGKFDGLIITDFLSKEDLGFFSSHFDEVVKKYPDLTELIDNGFTFGKTFFDVPDCNTYKKLIPLYESIELELFGFSLKNRFLETIRHISSAIPVKIASHTDQTPFLSNTVRVLTPGKGGLFIHADLQIHESFREADNIMKQINKNKLLSIFTVLQKPEKGGRLLLYDLTYNNTPPDIYADGEHKYDNIKSYVSNFAMYPVDLPPGSLILFNAGTQWHAIEPVEGKIPRITAGAFNGYSKENSEIYIWS